MYQTFAHATQYHSTETAEWQHTLTEPFVMNLLFVVIAAALGWFLQEKLRASQLVRSSVLGVFCLITAILSLNYDKPLSIVAWTLAIICGLVIVTTQLSSPSIPKTISSKKPAKKK